MAFTTDQLTTLDAAIAQGALTVKYADKEVTYRSLSEMIQLRQLMKAELGQGNSNNGRTYGSYSKGLC